MKKIFGILLFFAFNFFCDAQNINFFTSKIEKTLTGGLTFRHLSDFSMENAAADICFSADMKELSFNSGFKLQSGIFDFTTQARYAPTIARHFNVGVMSTFHINVYSDIFSEIDFLTGLYLKYDTLKHFKISSGIFYFYKEARIFSIADKIPRIYNHNLAKYIEFCFAPIQNLSLYMNIASYTYYRYTLYFSPDLKLGGEYRFSDWLSLGNEWDFQYIDMFTLSANYNGFENRFFVKLRF